MPADTGGVHETDPPEGACSLMQASSSDSDRAGLKVDFNFFKAEQTYHGIKKLCYSNGFSDPAFVSEEISWRPVVSRPQLSFSYGLAVVVVGAAVVVVVDGAAVVVVVEAVPAVVVVSPAVVVVVSAGPEVVTVVDAVVVVVGSMPSL